MQLHTRRIFGFKLIFSMLLLTPVLPVVAQNRIPQERMPVIPPCPVRSVDRPCAMAEGTWTPLRQTRIAQTMIEPQTAAAPVPARATVTYTYPDGSVITMCPAATMVARPAPTVARPPAHEQSTPRANPDAPDQSELLKNSKDRDFILHNFRTMYVDTTDIEFFGSDQMKAALHDNTDFEKLNIRIVDDRRVADVVLVVGYTFAWDYPFELRHQNTTMVLLAGKGEGPFSGPLGAADVARVFVDLAKPWRTPPPQKK